MPRRPTATSRWLTALTWPVGVSLTSWDYMWRSTPLHRREVAEPPSRRASLSPVGDAVREASPALTARRLSADDPSHEQLARNADDEV